MTQPSRSICARASRGKAGTESRNRLELVEGASGVAESSTGHHGDGNAAAGHHRREKERHLVANAAGRVLVYPGKRVSVETESDRPRRASRQ